LRSLPAAIGVLVLLSGVVAFGRVRHAEYVAVAMITHVASPRTTAGLSEARPHPHARYLWSHRLPESGFANVRVVFPLAVVTESDRLAVIDARTGVERWRRTDVGSVSATTQRDVLAADTGGGVTKVSLVSGAVRWRTRRICDSPETPFAVGTIAANGDDVFAGCVDAGRLVRIDASNGVVRASRTFSKEFPISEIRELRNGVVFAGWTSSGAAMRFNTLLLRRRDLSPLAALPQDTRYIGLAGDVAIFDDRCCNGRFDGPVTIVRYDVARRALTSPIALTLDPDPFRGMGANTALVGSRLLSSSIPYLDDYGDARAPRTIPRHLARGLREPAMYLADGKTLEERRASDGRTESVLSDVAHAKPHVIWQSEMNAVPTYDAVGARDVIAFTEQTADANQTRFVRTTDGAELRSDVPCGPFASDGHIVVADCFDRRLGKHGRKTIRSYVIASPR
jgi:hypothetical protein